MGNKIVILCLILFICFSCGKKPETPAEYKAFCNDPDNGLLVKKSIGQMNYEVQYMTAELMAMNELKPGYSRQMFDSVVDTYEGGEYFTITILPPEGTELNSAFGQSIYAVQSYYSFQVGEDICLIESGDTISPVIIHNPKTYELARTVELIVAFATGFEKENRVKLRYTDLIFNGGTMNFVFDFNEIKLPEFPQIK